jgi:hypothetical protein
MIRKRPATSRHRRTDSDLHKGAVEADRPRRTTNNSLAGQLPHRPKDEMIDGQDTDFPEPGGNPEHSGEPEGKKNPEGETQNQDPGHRQKQNQNDRREDPLAS